MARGNRNLWKDLVKCHICKRWFKTIYAHLRVHGVSSRKYSEMFPGAPLRNKVVSFSPSVEGRRRTAAAVTESNKRRWRNNREGEAALLKEARKKRSRRKMALNVSLQMTEEKKRKMSSAVSESNQRRWKENREVELRNIEDISSPSKACMDIFEESRVLFPDAVLGEWDVLDGREIDIWIPSRRLAIEYHGLWWHSMKMLPPNRFDQDYRKYLSCLSRGIRLLQIYSDDWELRRSVILDLLNRLADHKYGRRVYKTKAREISKDCAENFLGRNHYLSGSSSPGSLYVGLFSGDEMVAASVFRWMDGASLEWVRHSVLSGIRSWNPGSYCLETALKVLGPERVVSFSDNRLHIGNLYKKLGFMYDGETGQSYEYTDGRKRKHKFLFRVPSGIDEEACAASDGWYRIYDSGKKRWVFSC
jgi:hypothetical protein